MLRPQLFPNFSKPGPSKLGPYDSEPEIRLAPPQKDASGMECMLGVIGM